MTDHYYSTQPSSEHDLKKVEFNLRGVKLSLFTDSGVFSKNRIDTGTELLMKSLAITPDLHTVYDLGCGYGPIGLFIAKSLPETKVYMSDVNERAVDLACRNAALNRINNVEIRSGEGFTPFPDLRFDLVVTNPPIRAGKQVLYALVEEAWESLTPGGSLVLVILTRQGAKSLETKMFEVFGNVVETEKQSGYRVIASKR